MEKKDVVAAVTALKDSDKRKFPQSYELIINIKNIDLKNQQNQLDYFLTLPKSTSRPVKVCALVGGELKVFAEAACDKVIPLDEFPKYEGNKKALKKLTEEYDYFIAQATIMPQVAKVFGRVFGPRGKMPNPKAGCVVPPNANLKPLVEKLQRTIRTQSRKSYCLQCIVGKESLSSEDLVENIFSLYNQVLHLLPQEKNNVKNVLLKKTMGKPVKVGATVEEVAA
ncbi:MAG TPA: 50S ribosomal protein L1 [Candidatus Nanoarchaeia archaeon]|nr:50S ribosomal protein L1 [Candidatus Nanoarchaeia archaeon]